MGAQRERRRLMPLFLPTLCTVAIAVAAYMAAVFLVAVALRDNSVADIAWGPGFILAGGVAWWLNARATPRAALVLTLVALWGVRLAAHIFARHRGKGEDFRYAGWRAEWGSLFLLRSFLQVFMLQGALLVIVALPVLYVMAAPGPAAITLLDALGTLVWLTGFVFESVGDLQLTRFLADPANRGRVMTTGLWRCTRHPNYFGEVACWWGIYLIACAVPGGWLTVPGPLVITVLILFVSGIPLLEAKSMLKPEFREYAKRTNAFFPWFPKGDRP